MTKSKKEINVPTKETFSPGFSKMHWDISKKHGYSLACLYGIIQSLCEQKDFCFSNTKYLSEIMKCSERQVYTWLAELERLGYIYRSTWNTRRGSKREITTHEKSKKYFHYLKRKKGIPQEAIDSFLKFFHTPFPDTDEENTEEIADAKEIRLQNPQSLKGEESAAAIKRIDNFNEYIISSNTCVSEGNASGNLELAKTLAEELHEIIKPSRKQNMALWIHEMNRLLKDGLDQDSIRSMIQIIPGLGRYAPTITNASDFVNKWEKLESYVKRQDLQKKEEKTKFDTSERYMIFAKKVKDCLESDSLKVLPTHIYDTQEDFDLTYKMAYDEFCHQLARRYGVTNYEKDM